MGTSLRHLRVGLRLGARERALDALGVRSQRCAEHAKDGARVFLPARRRQLGLAHGSISVELEEALERAARRPFGDRVEAGRRLALDHGARFGLASREGGDVHDPDARAGALEVADPARERLHEAVGVGRRDALGGRCLSARCAPSVLDAEVSITVPVRSSSSWMSRNLRATPSSGRIARSSALCARHCFSAKASKASTSSSSRSCSRSRREAVSGRRA